MPCCVCFLQSLCSVANIWAYFPSDRQTHPSTCTIVLRKIFTFFKCVPVPVALWYFPPYLIRSQLAWLTIVQYLIAASKRFLLTFCVISAWMKKHNCYCCDCECFKTHYWNAVFPWSMLSWMTSTQKKHAQLLLVFWNALIILLWQKVTERKKERKTCSVRHDL